MHGVWLPLITPFIDGAVDLRSHARLCEVYAGTGVSGIILLGTTGESPTVTADERVAIVRRTREVISKELPVFLGVSGSSTAGVTGTVAQLDDLDVDGYLVTSPYYSRPPQDGIRAHFEQVCAATDKPVVLYNIPYRTGSNVATGTVLRIAERCANLVAVKDSCGNLEQSFDLIRRAPGSLAVLTGEDAQFFATSAAGGAGGILAAAHVATGAFVRVHALLRQGELDEARRVWFDDIVGFLPSLFAESNPMPLKHVLWRAGLIASPECRLPLTEVSAGLAARLESVARLVPSSTVEAGELTR